MNGGWRLVRKYFVINQNWRLVLRITDKIESTTNLFGVIVFYFSPIQYIYLIFSHFLSLFISMKYTVLLLCVFYERIYLFMLQFQLFVSHAFTIHLDWDEQLNHSKKQVTCASHIFSTIKRKQTMWKQMCALHIFSFCWYQCLHTTINWRFLIFFFCLSVSRFVFLSNNKFLQANHLNHFPTCFFTASHWIQKYTTYFFCGRSINHTIQIIINILFRNLVMFNIIQLCNIFHNTAHYGPSLNAYIWNKHRKFLGLINSTWMYLSWYC